MTRLHIDVETRSNLDLRTSGLYRYAFDKSTSLLMMAYAFDDEEVKLWEPHVNQMPEELFHALVDPTIKKIAWNTQFERQILSRFVTWVHYVCWEDPMVSARMLSLPGSLGQAGEILQLPPEMLKLAEGKKLIDLFSKPTKVRKSKKNPNGPFLKFNDWASHPEEWATFREYCMQDVRTEREIARRLQKLGVYPLPERERKFWLFDQKVNDFGLPVDLDFVQKALKLAVKAKEDSKAAQNALTGLENANSNAQMLAWAKTQGYTENSLGKATVAAALKNNQILTPVCRQALIARQTASSTTYKKLETILERVSSDGRLRGLFSFLGSARAGRWSSNGVQFHNQARPDPQFEDDEILDEVRKMILNEDYEGIVNKFESVLSAVKSTMRTSFATTPDKRLNVCDLNAIEVRVAAWMAGCESLLNVFRDNKDPYIAFATNMTGIPYEKLYADYKAKELTAKRHRTNAKPALLGGIYGLGGGQLGKNRYGDIVKQGLWGYAESMGIEMSQDKAHESIKVLRASYSEIPKMWSDIERAIEDVLKEGTVRVKRFLGPNDCIKFDKISIKDQLPILRIQLPSGRCLHYLSARIENLKMPWLNHDGEQVYKDTLVYAGINQETKKWESNIKSRGSKIFENLVQGCARDILATKLVEIDEADMPICGHVHDEGISQTADDDFTPGVTEMEEIMSQPIVWAPLLPLAADGFQSNYYKK